MAQVKDALLACGSGSGSAPRLPLQPPVSPPEATPSIAVLPFANMSRDADDEYFSDGLAEEIINALTQVPELKVIARTSAFAFKGKNEDIRKIAETLGVSSVLEGSVRRAGPRLRVTAQLIRAEDGTHLWSQRYESEMTDVFAIQDEISAAIVKQLRLNLTGQSLVKRAVTNVAAYEATLEGRHHISKFTPDANDRARQCFERAIEVDSGYAPAYAGIAEYHVMQAGLGAATSLQELPLARKAALRALDLDPIWPRRTRCRAYLRRDSITTGPLPNNTICAPSLPIPRRRPSDSLRLLVPAPDWEELPSALAELGRAVELDPLSVYYGSARAYLLSFAGPSRRRSAWRDDAPIWITAPP